MLQTWIILSKGNICSIDSLVDFRGGSGLPSRERVVNMSPQLRLKRKIEKVKKEKYSDIQMEKEMERKKKERGGGRDIKERKI